VNIVSVTNSGSADYEVTFSEAVTVSTSGLEVNFLFWSPAANRWRNATAVNNAAADTVHFIASNAATDCTLCVILAQPAFLTAAHPFKTAAPITPIP
jgi:hypothetical protein